MFHQNISYTLQTGKFNIENMYCGDMPCVFILKVSAVKIILEVSKSFHTFNQIILSTNFAFWCHLVGALKVPQEHRG